jgi:hypothetical protein
LQHQPREAGATFAQADHPRQTAVELSAAFRLACQQIDAEEIAVRNGRVGRVAAQHAEQRAQQRKPTGSMPRNDPAKQVMKQLTKSSRA